MTRLTERIAERVKALRDELGMSQEALARAANVSVRTISRIEQGETGRPREPEFHRIAQALGTTADVLMGVDEQDATVIASGDEPTDEALDAEIGELTSNPDVLLAFMGNVRDPKKLSRAMKLVLREDLR